MLTIKNAILASVILNALFGCGGGTSEAPDSPAPTTPSVSTGVTDVTVIDITDGSATVTWQGSSQATVWVEVKSNNTIGPRHEASGNIYTFTRLGSNMNFVVKVQGKGSTKISSFAFKTKIELDTTAPVITLLGDSSITVTVDQNSVYTDAGATANDNKDGNISNNIVVNNPVDTATVGTYTVTYNVKDMSNNSATEVTRTVTVTPVIAKAPNHAPTVSNINITGIAKTGKTLTLNYIFNDEDSDAEGKSIIVWSTAKKELQRSTNKTFVIPTGYEGQTISAWVHPKDAQGLEGKVVVSSNNALKVLTQYEEAVTLPQYDANNPEMMLITSDADWENINNSNKRFFFVKPGDYSKAGTELYDRITLTASGTKDKKRYIILHNSNNTHPGKLERNQLAKVGFILKGANHWVIDRMAYWDSPTELNPILVKESSNNVFNRLYFHDIGNGLYIYPSSHGNVIQNSRFERDDISIFHDRAAVGIFNDHKPTAVIKNTRIVNNEILNFVDGIQTIRMNIDKTPENNFEGTIIDSNHIYIDKTFYTDCQGNHDDNGSCAYAENALDFKIGSANVDNPMIISNNKMWGFRKADETNSTLASSGALMPVHYGVDHVLIKDNIGFDSAEGFSCGDPRYGASVRNTLIENNIFQNITGIAIIVADSQQLTIKNNLFKDVSVGHPYHWITAYTNTNLTFSENLIVSTHAKTARLRDDNVNFSASNNQYFKTDYTQIADTVNATDVVLDTDPTDNYKDLVFTTDRYTSNPRTITVPNVLKPNG